MSNHSQSTALARAIVCVLLSSSFAAGCDKPETDVVVDNEYPAWTPGPPVVYRAKWKEVWFDGPISPGASSDPQPAVPASPNTAYVLLAPGWDPTTSAAPTSLVVMQSKDGFDLHLDNTLHIPVDDAHFIGNCAAGSFLSQEQADFITQLVFPSDFESLTYDAATCATTPIGNAGSE